MDLDPLGSEYPLSKPIKLLAINFCIEENEKKENEFYGTSVYTGN